MTSLNMGRVWVCFPHDPKAILNSKSDKFSLSAKVNSRLKTKRKRQKRRRTFMKFRLNKNIVYMQRISYQ
jgi:hypothetical protein